MTRPLTVLGLALLTSIVASCSSTGGSTTLVVAVYSDLTVGTEIDAIDISIGGGELVFPFALGASAGQTHLPVRVALVPGGKTDESFEVTATGMRSASRIVAQSAVVSFVPGLREQLVLFLGRSCVSVPTCPGGSSCENGTCVPETDIGTRGPYDGTDASVDVAEEAGAPTDSSADGSRSDATVDAPVEMLDASTDHSSDSQDLRPPDGPADALASDEVGGDGSVPPDRHWVERTAPGARPPGRRQLALAFDENRNRVVLFGGADNAFYQDLWEWNPSDGTWLNRTPTPLPTNWPTARSGHRMVYIPASKTILLHGGSAGDSNAFSDLWIWNGTSGTWSMAPSAPIATARAWHGFAYDSTRGRVVLFGGANLSGNPQDTWELDPTSFNWTDRTPAGPKPTGRAHVGMAYDDVRKRMVVSGDDTWEWDGATASWERRTASGAGPSAPYGIDVLYDSGLQTALVFGGLVSGSASSDLSLLGRSASAWAKASQGTSPPARFDYGAAFDRSRGRLVVFGGDSDPTNATFFQDIWEW
jgi:Galactose oxidase, central domain